MADERQHDEVSAKKRRMASSSASGASAMSATGRPASDDTNGPTGREHRCTHRRGSDVTTIHPGVDGSSASTGRENRTVEPPRRRRA